jgi:Sulfotransferase family
VNNSLFTSSVELISVHIPKTAGMTFLYVLYQVYSLDLVLWDHPSGVKYEPTSSTPLHKRVIHGHFMTHKYDGFFPNAIRITWVREPIVRLISHYLHIKNRPLDKNNPVHMEVVEKNLSLLQFAEIPDMQNFMSSYTAGRQLTDYYFVGVQEFFNEDLFALKKMLNWGEFTVTINNNNPNTYYNQKLQEYLADTELINQLKFLNSKDVELYEAALNQRAKRQIPNNVC